MITFSYGSSFDKAFKKRISSDENHERKFYEKLELFLNNPFDPQLRTHKLSGRLAGLYSFRVDYDIRVVFYFAEKNHAVFVDVGTHDEVY